eukprot:55702-Heterocapsa_arctica.AAC.1
MEQIHEEKGIIIKFITKLREDKEFKKSTTTENIGNIGTFMAGKAGRKEGPEQVWSGALVARRGNGHLQKQRGAEQLLHRHGPGHSERRRETGLPLLPIYGQQG